MNAISTLLYVDDDPLLAGMISRWAGRAQLSWGGHAATPGEAVQNCLLAPGRLVLVSTDLVGGQWSDLVRQLASLDSKPVVVLFAKRFSDAFLYCSRRAPIAGVISRSAAAERDFLAAAAAIRGGRNWFCSLYTEAATAFDKNPLAFFKVLSAQELALLRSFGLGLPDVVIAERRKLAPSTVQTHRKHVMRKLGLHSARELVCWAISRGVVEPGDFTSDSAGATAAG